MHWHFTSDQVSTVVKMLFHASTIVRAEIVVKLLFNVSTVVRAEIHDSLAAESGGTLATRCVHCVRCTPLM